MLIIEIVSTEKAVRSGQDDESDTNPHIELKGHSSYFIWEKDIMFLSFKLETQKSLI